MFQNQPERYLEPSAEKIEKSQTTVETDAFLDPLEGPIEPMVRQAIGYALKMRGAVEAENLAEPGLPPLNIGIGPVPGRWSWGISAPSRTKYGIIGAANLTHRIQGQVQGREVVVSEMVFHHSEENLAVSRTFETKLKGIAHPVRLYVVSSMGGEA